MTRSKRRTSALSSGSPKSPKSPRVRQDPKIDSAAADRGSSPATDGPGPHNCAASTQVHHPPQSPSPSFPTSRTTQREERSVSVPPATEAALGRASPSPSRNYPPLRPQPALPGPFATASGAHRRAAWAAPRPPPPSSALTTVRGPLNPRQHAAAARTPSSSAALNRTPPSLQDRYCSSSTPPPARAHTPSPSRGGPSSASSSETSPVSCHSTAISVISKRSYASALKGGGPANQNPYAHSSRRLYIYLEKFAIISEATACHNHKGPIITLKETGSSDLKIVQVHLEEYDTELAHAVFNSQHRFEEWLYATVSQFLTSKGIVKNAVPVSGMNATLYTMPPSYKTLKDFVEEQGPLVSIKSVFGGFFKLCVASDIGMMLVHGFLVYILDIHKRGLTWNGEFSTSDMVVGNCLKCRITLRPRLGKSHCRAADLHKIAEIFKPMFTNNEGMALYFDVLQNDLCEASNVEVEAEWFREYLLSHLALKSSIRRYYLECALDHARDTIKSNGNPIPSVLLEGSDWMSIIPHEITKDTPCTVSSLYKVFWFNHDPTAGFHPFAPTNEGLLRYKRNFLQHVHKHIKVQDHTEIEQFAAKTFHLALPNILRGLLSRCEMNGPFKGHWEEYRSSRVGNDGNTEGRTGIHISFSEDGSDGGQV
ncbi:uncharacterized protein [Miscanthus floridulus]|uniref:uncharacterized protein n=1 Tax=Miscanthus floridulus TaxID=154761 RepID=UPI00345AC3DA